jgi:hypothetical protein
MEAVSKLAASAPRLIQTAQGTPASMWRFRHAARVYDAAGKRGPASPQPDDTWAKCTQPRSA